MMAGDRHPAPPETSPGDETHREEIHFRRIDLRGYRRGDGLFEVEGRLSDRKPFPFVRPGSGELLAPNQPIHDMGVRLVFDADMLVRSVETFTDTAPYPACPEGGRALQGLVGLRMSKGWNREVRARLGGARSCTHLMELMPAMATAAFQSMSSVDPGLSMDDVDETGRPRKIDSCYAYAADGDLVKARWPAFGIPVVSVP